MAVTVAEDIQKALVGYEKEKVEEFKQSPGYGGSRVRLRFNYSDRTVEYVTYGAGPLHTGVFYLRQGDDYQIIGVGQYDGKKNNKQVYSALWDGNQNRRVQVTVQGHI